MLLKAGADVNASPAVTSGRTALEEAEHGRLDLVQLLLNAGAGSVQRAAELARTITLS